MVCVALGRPMRIVELVYTHALLLEARSYLSREDRVPPGAFAAYDDQPVRPHHVHRGKQAHLEAIDRLLVGFRTVEQQPTRATI